MYPAQELENALSKANKALAFVEVSKIPEKFQAALNNDQVGVRVIIPTGIRNALYLKDMERQSFKGKAEMLGLGNLGTLELTRVDSLMSI